MPEATTKILPYGTRVASRYIARVAVGDKTPGLLNAMNHLVAGYQFERPAASRLIDRDDYDVWYDAMTANGHRIHF